MRPIEPRLMRVCRIAAVSAAIIVSLFLAKSYNYLLFHSIVEICYGVIAFGMFMIAWNSRKFLENQYLLFLGVAYLFVGGIGVIHALAYKGMAIFPGYDTNTATQLWIAARYLESVSLLLAPVFLRRPAEPILPIIAGYAGVSGLAASAIFLRRFPDCFVEGVGLTPFKAVSEYLICAILAAAIVLARRERRAFDPRMLRGICASIGLSMAAELAFALYDDPFGLINFAGHVLKLFAFYLLYQAIIESGLRHPYALMFRELTQTADALRAAHDDLELRVAERTDALRQEIEERKQTEMRLQTTERALRESKRRLEEAEHIASLGYWELKPDQRALRCSNEMLRILEQDPEQGEISYDAFLAIVHGADRDKVRSMHSAVMADKQPAKLAHRLRMADMSIKHVQQRCELSSDADGLAARLIGTMQDVSEQRLVEDQLNTALQELDLFFSVALDLLCIADTEGYFRKLNPMWTRTLGYSLDELSGTRFLDFVHPEDMEATFGAIAKLMEQQEVTKFVNRYRKKDGTYCYLEWASFPVGKMIYASARDITERIDTLQQLRESDERWQFALEGSGDGVWDWDAQTNRVYFSRQWKAMLGFQPEEVGDTLDEWDRRVHPDDRERVYAELNQHFNGETPIYLSEHRVLCKDGSYKWILDRGKIISRLPDGKPKRVIGTHSDISTRKQAEEELRLFKTILESSKEGVAVSDAAGRIIYINSAHERLFGRSFFEAKTTTFRDYYPPETLAALGQDIAPALRRGESWQGVLDAVDAHGRRFPLWQHLGVILDAEGNLLYGFGFMHDDSRRIQAEEELKAAKEAAEQSSRVKSDFLATMSHEIRTPMNAVLGFTELLDGLISDPKQRSYLEAIQSGGKTLLTLINDMLDLSKIEAGKMATHIEPVRIHRLLEEIQKIFSLKTSQKSLDFSIDIAPSLPKLLLLDEARLRQVLFNLVGNAVKFTDSGYIHVAASFRKQEQDDDALDLMITVEDSGMGIPPREQQAIFEAFHQYAERPARKFGGTGLGLTISRRLVEMMGGTITVRSEEGQGSAFTVLLRQVAIAALENAPEETSQSALDISGLRSVILVVDDVESNRRLLTSSFEGTAIKTVEAANGADAVQIARAKHPDVVLMDLKMPVMNGYDAFRHLQRDPALRDIPVIAVTASSQELEHDATLADFAGYLRKPVSRSVLLQEICRVLHYQPPAAHAEASQTEEAQPLSANALAALPDVLEQLEQIFMLSWQELQTIQPVNSVKQFGMDLKDLGDQSRLPLLTDYGTKLLAAVEFFDIERMRQTLREFPAVLATVQALAHSH